MASSVLALTTDVVFGWRSKFTVGGETVTSFLAIDTNGDREGDSGEAVTDGVFHESTLRSAPYFGLKIDGINELNNN